MAGVGGRLASELDGGGVVTMQENDVSGVSYAESGEPRGYTRWLLMIAGLASSVTVNAILLVYVAKGGVHQ
ncbi:hypothetical protein KGQ19_14975 [Catenulispora sp. NL8]|uniref:Uncharacterized protein n=1 Tax=Catenulispora pinistramenti TaxID=2705254 RepID=A0ABS5KQ95_9ACTN|nr:hypothetical protein [Catenulispora pinistramenti]MBS2548169.1 hypothetical protein [Catenulispora pinistramenti]